jgi:N-methylhydantoinase B
VPVREFLTGYRQTACRADEIVTAILVPKLAGPTRSHFLKLGARRYLVISIVMAAGVIETAPDGRIARARIAIGACSPVAPAADELEAALRGQSLATAADIAQAGHVAHLAPIDDIRASADYRRHAALSLTRDLLSDLAAITRRAA